MKKRSLLLGCLLICSSALAQTMSTTQLDSIVAARPTLSGAVAQMYQNGCFMQSCAVGSAIVLTGSVQPTVVTLVSPVAATITGLQVTLAVSGKNWSTVAPFNIPITPVAVPAGGTVQFTYSDAFGAALSASFVTVLNAIESFSTSPATLIASVTPPIAPPSPPAPVPTPTPVPVPVPPPSPPPASTASALGDCVGKLDLVRWPSCKNLVPQLTETSGVIWKLSGSTVTRAGVDTKNPFTNAGQTLSLEMAAPSAKSSGGVIHVNTLDHGFNCWDAATSKWAGSGC